MAVNVVDLSDQSWSEPPDSWEGRAEEGKPGVRYKAFATPFAGVPTGQLVEYEPGHAEPPHSHPESELLYLIEGELRIGHELYVPGAVIAIEGATTYGPLESPAGCRFLRLHVER